MAKETYYILKEASINCFKTKQNAREWLQIETDSDNIGKNGIKDTQDVKRFAPVLVRTNFYSFFKCLEEEAEKGRNSKILGGDCISLSENVIKERVEEAKNNIEKTKRKIENNYLNFLLNSSIWIRFCDNGDWDGKDDGTKTENIKDAQKEFIWFKELGLYDYKAAKEYIEYQLRAQKNNYLESFGAHDVHITPMLYSDEVKYRDFFLKGKDNGVKFKFLSSCLRNKGFQTHDVELRILLLDDKIFCNNHSVACDTCDKKNESGEPCKLSVIRKLLSGDFMAIVEDGNKQWGDSKFNEKTYWVDNVNGEDGKSNKVKACCTNRLKIGNLWEWNENIEELVLKNDYTNNLPNLIKESDKGKNCVQIVGVPDIETALALMSCCKFDIILLDYLLGERSDSDNGRTYSTELFEFLSYDFMEQRSSHVVEMLKNSIDTEKRPDKTKFLKKIQNNVKLNRGPLGKYWFMPMTSYNSSFISDLQRKNVQLIDYHWNISQGADPLNTPWKFLHKINEFIDLQLRHSVFTKKKLMTFLQYSGEDLMESLDPEKLTEMDSCFEEFQQFMGAEYANFMKRYGARKLIERDAAKSTEENNNENKSVFATYISKNFYNNSDYSTEIELNRLMQDFYHQAATMFDDRDGRKRLREAFEQMRLFITYNQLEQILDEEGRKKLKEGLLFFNTVIDSEFDVEKIKK